MSDLIDNQGLDPPLRIIVLTNYSMSNCKWIELLQFLTTCNYLTTVRLTEIPLGELGFHLAQSIKSWGGNPQLQVLCLSSCSMPQELWPEVFQSLSGCKHLRELHLNNNTVGRSGHHLAQMIRSWGYYPPLLKLDLMNCSIYEQVCADVLQSLATCRNLMYLDLTGNTLGESGYHMAQTIRSWGNNPPLQQLGLKNCSIPEQVCADVLQSLATCRDLTNLDLTGNTLGESGYHLAQMIRSYGNDSLLQQLGLRNCSLPEQVCADVLQPLATCGNLIYLDLTGNTLGESGYHLAQMIRSWGNNPPLKLLGLRNCSLPGQMCADVLHSLATCRNLTYLDLTGNTLGETGYYLARVIRSWGNDPPLQQLGLRNCSLPAQLCAEILQSVARCRNLKHLSISDNTLGEYGHHLEQVKGSWGYYPALLKLDLKNCSLPEQVCAEILQCIAFCRNLTYLDVTGNTLGKSGYHLAQMIRSWGNDPPLQQLGLRNCSLHEQVCADVLQSLATCRNLTYLDLTGNTLGEPGYHLAQVITSWGIDPALQQLDLMNCSLPEQVCAEILQSLATCRNLTYLDLTGNTLGETGYHLARVIRSWGNTPPLQQLGLRNCSLPEQVCADVLQSLATCRYLTYFDLTGNTLGESGYHMAQMIRSWGNNPPMQQLGLKNCSMPEQVCADVLQHLVTCRGLTYLDLTGNTLGESGYHLAQMITSQENDSPLKLLGLRNCSMPEQVSADVLQSLATCRHLTYLDLTGNTLGESGYHLAQMIRSWGNDPPLKLLGLRNCSMPEQMCADVLQSIATCRNLTHLILGNNTLAESGRHLAESIRSWGDDPPLKIINLEITAIKRDVWEELLQVLSTCKRLTSINLSGNVLTGCLQFLMRHSELPSLQTLGLNSTGLSKDDVNYLSNLIQKKMISGLSNLHLEGNNLWEMQAELAELINARDMQMGLTLHLGTRTSGATMPGAKFTEIHSEQKIEKVKTVNQHAQVILN